MNTQIGVFLKEDMALSDCLTSCELALERESLQIFEKSGFLRSGIRPDLAVTTVCIGGPSAPTQVAVIATSTVSPTAELARNQIREFIIDDHIIDRGSASNPVSGG
jgi:hypothetical protein